MAIINGNKNNFKELINNKVIVDFYADWCGPCKMLSPVLDKISDEENIDIVKINVDNDPELAKEYGIMSIPTIIVFENGEEKNKNIGLCSKQDIKDMIK